MDAVAREEEHGRAGTGPVRVAYVYVTLATGGAERHLATLLAFLDRSRFEPHVLCLSEEGKIGAEVRRTGVAFRVFGLPRKRLWLPGGLWRVASYLRRNRIEIVHTHMYHANAYGRMAALLARVPHIVATVHTTGRHPLRKQRVTNRLLNRFTDRTIFVSEAARRALLVEGGLSAEKTVVIHNGIDLARYSGGAPRAPVRESLGIPSGSLVLAVVARLEPEKRHRDLLRAFREALKDVRDAFLLVVGDGSLAGAIRQEVRALGLEARVRLTGERNDVPDILNITDLFVLPSEREGAPLAVLEAMAAGLPVVASAVGGIPEMLGDEAGITFAAGDVAALTDALRRCLCDAGRRRIMGAAALERVTSHFSGECMTRRVEEVYEQIL